eukprot:tig00000552_g2070.t1
MHPAPCGFVFLGLPQHPSSGVYVGVSSLACRRSAPRFRRWDAVLGAIAARRWTLRIQWLTPRAATCPRGARGSSTPASDAGEARPRPPAVAQARMQAEERSLDDPVSALPGVGPVKAQRLRSWGLGTVRGLLEWVPRDRVHAGDRASVAALAGMGGSRATVVGRVSRVRAAPARSRPRLVVLTLAISDDSGASVEVVKFYNGTPAASLLAAFQLGTLVSASGTVEVAGPADAQQGGYRKRPGSVSLKSAEVNILRPAWEAGPDAADPEPPRVTPLYRLPSAPGEAGSGRRGAAADLRLLGAAIQAALPYAELFEDPLPPDILEKLGLPPLSEAMQNVHGAAGPDEMEAASRRLVFDELLALQLALLLGKAKRRSRRCSVPPSPPGELIRRVCRTPSPPACAYQAAPSPFAPEEEAKRGPEGAPAPHVLSMSATPIPRTLALALHGDLDISVLDEMPSGRKPIRTRLLRPEEREDAYSVIREHCARGHQAYVLFPLVEESEAMAHLVCHASRRPLSGAALVPSSSFSFCGGARGGRPRPSQSGPGRRPPRGWAGTRRAAAAGPSPKPRGGASGRSAPEFTAARATAARDAAAAPAPRAGRTAIQGPRRAPPRPPCRPPPRPHPPPMPPPPGRPESPESPESGESGEEASGGCETDDDPPLWPRRPSHLPPYLAPRAAILEEHFRESHGPGCAGDLETLHGLCCDWGAGRLARWRPGLPCTPRGTRRPARRSLPFADVLTGPPVLPAGPAYGAEPYPDSPAAAAPPTPSAPAPSSELPTPAAGELERPVRQALAARFDDGDFAEI